MCLFLLGLYRVVFNPYNWISFFSKFLFEGVLLGFIFWIKGFSIESIYSLGTISLGTLGLTLSIPRSIPQF